MTAIACALTTMTAAPAFAQQTAPSPDTDKVIITGIRGALERSMDEKRYADGIVDSISSEDIGKYPDTNLAESIQRITGVSINRVNGEGSEVTVRGFGPGFNLVTLNSRVMPTANIAVVGSDNDFAGGGSRNFDFSNLASDGVSGLEVFKTGQADRQSGGIGAVLNIKTLRPLDRDGFTASLTAKALSSQNVIDGDEVTPELSGAMSWSNDENTLGLSLFGQYQERASSTRGATQNAWNLEYANQFFAPGSGRVRYDTGGALLTQITDRPAATDLVTYPNDSRYFLANSESKRSNIQATGQFRPTESLLFTVDALYAEQEATENRAEQTNWFNRPFDQVVFQKGASGIYSAVYLQENLSGVKDIGFEQQQRSTKDSLTSIGLNADWKINDQFSVNFDLHQAEGKADPNNANGSSSTLMALGAPVIAAHSVDFRSGIPIQAFTVNDALRGNNNGKLDAGDLGSQVARTATNSQSNEITEFRADATYKLDDMSSFHFGVDLMKSKMETTTGQTYQALGDWGISNPGDVALYAPNAITTFDLASLYQSFNVGNAGVAFRGDAQGLYTALAAGYNATIPTTSLTSNTIEEDVRAVYAKFRMEGQLVGLPTKVVAGLRYEETDVDASASQSIPTAIRWTADNDFTTDFGAGLANIGSKSNYNNWLPSLDVSVDLTEALIARASVSKTIARAGYSNLYATTTVNTPPRPTLNGTNPTATRGNAGLLPLESSNFDVSLEWYYDDASFVSVGFYNKDVANFVGTGQVTQTQFDLRDPTSGAAGSRSGTAATALAGISQATTDVNLFTMTALLIKNNNNVAAATAEYQANLTGGNLNQAFVDQTLAAYDITADANDPLFRFETSLPINNKNANLHGFEVALQHFFGDTGFGVAASYTSVLGDVKFDNTAPPGTSQFPLLGLSDTYNVTLIYDKGPLSGRLGYNWRDEYISNASRDGAAGNPTYVEAFGQLDLSVNYEITPNILVSFEGLNLTEETTRHHGRDDVNLYFAQELDSRYQIALRYKF